MYYPLSLRLISAEIHLPSVKQHRIILLLLHVEIGICLQDQTQNYCQYHHPEIKGHIITTLEKFQFDEILEKMQSKHHNFNINFSITKGEIISLILTTDSHRFFELPICIFIHYNFFFENDIMIFMDFVVEYYKPVLLSPVLVITFIVV